MSTLQEALSAGSGTSGEAVFCSGSAYPVSSLSIPVKTSTRSLRMLNLEEAVQASVQHIWIVNGEAPGLLLP